MPSHEDTFWQVIKGAAVDEVDKEEVKSKLMEMSKFSDFAQPVTSVHSALRSHVE